MILFFGVRNVVRDDPDGFAEQTRCPSCDINVSLQPKTVRTCFHVFWIPIIPVKQAEHVLQCPNCKARFVSRQSQP